MVVSNTKTPFEIKFRNGSAIRGQTTGASSGGGAVGFRGQRADALYLDESDYMSNADFDSILAIAAEREGIQVFLSSTPTGARKRFWQACTDPSMHFKEFHYPSTCNPNWGPEMEEEFRSQLSEQGYIHEVMADFGSQETGVFDKDKIDAAMKFMRYAYSPLTYSQQTKVEENGWHVDMYIPPENMTIGVYKPNRLRTMGVKFIESIAPPHRNVWKTRPRIAGKNPNNQQPSLPLNTARRFRDYARSPRTGEDIVHIEHVKCETGISTAPLRQLLFLITYHVLAALWLLEELKYQKQNTASIKL